MFITLTKYTGNVLNITNTSEVDVQIHNIVYMEANEDESGTHIMTTQGSLQVQEPPKEIKEKISKLEQAEINFLAKLAKQFQET